MNRHRQELDANREEMVWLSREVDDLKADKVMLEARIDSMSERLCRCSEASPWVCRVGSAVKPLELEDEELEYVTPPMTSSPAEEEVPSLVQGLPCFTRGFGLLTHGVLLAGSSSSSNPLLESSGEETQLRDAPLPGSVRGQRAVRGKRFRPYSHRKAPGHFPINTKYLGVERQRRRNERLLRRESAAQGGYAADSDDSLGTTDQSCGGASSDPEMGSGTREAVSDHSCASSIDGGARSVEPAVELPPHAFCSFVAGRRYPDRGPIVLDSCGGASPRDG